MRTALRWPGQNPAFCIAIEPGRPRTCNAGQMYALVGPGSVRPLPWRHGASIKSLPSTRYLPRDQRFRVAGEPGHGTKNHVADDAGDAEAFIVDQCAGQFLIAGKLGTDEARHVVDGAADFPALDHLFDRGDPLFE